MWDRTSRVLSCAYTLCIPIAGTPLRGHDSGGRVLLPLHSLHRANARRCCATMSVPHVTRRGFDGTPPRRRCGIASSNGSGGKVFRNKGCRMCNRKGDASLSDHMASISMLRLQAPSIVLECFRRHPSLPLRLAPVPLGRFSSPGHQRQDGRKLSQEDALPAQFLQDRIRTWALGHRGHHYPSHLSFPHPLSVWSWRCSWPTAAAGAAERGGWSHWPRCSY